jgi:predicted aspartyl protease
VRKLTVDAEVDTGAGPLVITGAMRQRLGLDIEIVDKISI